MENIKIRARKAKEVQIAIFGSLNGESQWEPALIEGPDPSSSAYCTALNNGQKCQSGSPFLLNQKWFAKVIIRGFDKLNEVNEIEVPPGQIIQVMRKGQYLEVSAVTEVFG